MPISSHLSKTLRQALGDEASEELLGMFVSNDSDHAAIRADIAELRHEMQLGFERQRGDLAATIERCRADLIERIEARYGDTMKWSFVFWVGTMVTMTTVIWALRP